MRSVDALKADQAAATEKWLDAVRQMRAALRTLEFPLGSPVQGYDLHDIDRVLSEWEFDGHDPMTLDWVARDLIAEDAFNRGADRNEETR